MIGLGSDKKRQRRQTSTIINYHSCTHNLEIGTLVNSEHLNWSNIGISVEKKKQFHNSEHSYVKSFVLCGIFCNSWTASATQISDTKDQVVLCSRMSILKSNSLYKVLLVLKTNRDEKALSMILPEVYCFFLATFNIFGYLLAFDGREDPKVLQWLCKSLHSLWFQDLIKKLLVIDRTKRIGNLKVFFFIFIGNLKVLKYLFVSVTYN